MRIAYIFHDAPNYCAGPRINALRLLPQFRLRGHEVHALIIYRRGSSPASAALQGQGISCRTTPWVDDTLAQIRWIFSQVKEIEPDVFVPNISVAGCYAGRWIREAGIPTVAGHLSNDERNWGRAKQFAVEAGDWALSGLFCMSDELKRAVEEMGAPRTHICTIPHGVPIPERTTTQEGPLRLAFAGRLEQRQKRIYDVISAMTRVMKIRPEITAKIIGHGREAEQLRDMVRWDRLAARFTFTGAVPPEQVQEELLDSHVLVLLSDFEGLPGAVMDGMACGLVPVCLDIPWGLRELVIHEQTGLLVSDRDQSFTDAILRIADDSNLRSRLAANARVHLQQGFSLKECVNRWERLFEHLLQTAGPRRRIRIPRQIDLPPVHEGLKRHDSRHPAFFERAARFCMRKTRDLGRRLLKVVHRFIK